MRILLVTLSDILPYALMQVLNPANEYCAIVVDDPLQSKKILEKAPQLREKIFPFYELKECVQNSYYDVLIGVYDDRLREQLPTQLNNYEIARNKFVAIYLANHLENSFLMERSLRYYREHAAEYEIFATGISYVAHGLDASCFKKKIFNFGRAAQDLYYGFQIAKFVLEVCGGGVYQVCIDWSGSVQFSL